MGQSKLSMWDCGYVRNSFLWYVWDINTHICSCEHDRNQKFKIGDQNEFILNVKNVHL